MILEGILTTRNADGSPRIAAMGAAVDDPRQGPIERMRLRPFTITTTFANLKRTRVGVFHLTDDVGLLARAALGRLDCPPRLLPAEVVEGDIVADASGWYALRVERIEEWQPRAEIEAKVVAAGRLRDFVGLNRAQHAIVEAAIVATRLQLIPPEQVRADLARLAVLVEKTGGPAERGAWEFVAAYVDEHLGGGR